MLMKQQLEAISIAERIRSLMGTDTEAAFAHRLRIAPHSVAVCLQGRVPDPGTLARISEVCEVSLDWLGQDRKSTRLNSSHVEISYAVFCLKKKNDDHNDDGM